MAAAQAEWEESVKDAVQADDEGAEYDPVFEARSAALDASATLLKTMKQQLQAFQNGTLGKSDKEAAEQETSSMLKTMKLREQEVSNAVADEKIRATAKREIIHCFAQDATNGSRSFEELDLGDEGFSIVPEADAARQ